MTATENYIGLQAASCYRRRAWKVWSFAAALTAAWLLLIVAAPVGRSDGISGAEGLYGFFGFLCHQQPDRSLHLGAEPLAVCSRCFGVYVGLFAGIVAYPLWRQIDNTEPLAKMWLILSLVPVTIDWSLTFLGVWDNTHTSRLLTGMVLGAACGTFIMPSIVEIARNLDRRTFARPAS